MKKLLAAFILFPSLIFAQTATDDLTTLAPGVTRGTIFMCANTTDSIDTGEFGAIRCGTNRQLRVIVGDGTTEIVVDGGMADDETSAVGLQTSSRNYIFDGANWDRWTGAVTQSGTWNIGTLTSITNSVAVTGTFWQATQPVSGTFWQATQPVSGTFWPTAAASPSSTRLSDGAAFYDATKTGQLPTALVGGRLDSNTGAWLGSTAPTVGQKTAANSIPVTVDTDNDAIGATGAAPPGEVVDIGGRTSGADTTGLMNAITACSDHVAVDIVTATTTLIVTGVANRHVRICSINLVTAAANNVALVAGTGATCGTSTAGINGGVTAAEGWNFGANGGIAQGSGIGEIMSTKVSGGATGDSVCIITSAATQLSGTVGYAIY